MIERDNDDWDEFYDVADVEEITTYADKWSLGSKVSGGGILFC